jgi:pantetheine-phosphate adenylyltransferase
MKLVDTLVIGVAVNEAKKPLFSLEERVRMVKAECAQFTGPGMAEIKVMPMHGLLMKFAEACGAQIILRGLRAVQDFEYEFQMAGMNRHLLPEVETLFMTPSDQYQFISGTIVREIAILGGDVSKFVFPSVERWLHAKAKALREAQEAANGQ